MNKQEKMAPLTVTLPTQTLAWDFRNLFNFDKQLHSFSFLDIYS